MVYNKEITTEVRAYIKCTASDSEKEVMAATGVSKAQIYCIRRELLSANEKPACRKGVGGRPRKLTNWDILIRIICSS